MLLSISFQGAFKEMTDKISGAVECVQTRLILKTEICPIKFCFIQIISMPYVNLTCKLEGTVRPS